MYAVSLPDSGFLSCFQDNRRLGSGKSGIGNIPRTRIFVNGCPEDGKNLKNGLSCVTFSPKNNTATLSQPSGFSLQIQRNNFTPSKEGRLIFPSSPSKFIICCIVAAVCNACVFKAGVIADEILVADGNDDKSK